MKRFTLSYILVGIISLCPCSVSGCIITDTRDTEWLRTCLISVSKSGKVIFGHQDDPVYGHGWCGDHGRSDVLETSGDYPGIMGWELGGLELNAEENIDGVNFKRMAAEALEHHQRGGINTFSWHASDPFERNNSWTTTDSTIVSRMVRTPEGLAQYKRQLGKLASFFNNLYDENHCKIPVIFRPWHEHTGDWFWWGARWCDADDYKKLWTVMREEFELLGVDNILWAYSPDIVTSETMYLERYPGDEYVDILGVDIYHRDGIEGIGCYRDAVNKAIEIMKKIAGGKPYAITETGLEGVTISDWYDSILLPLISGSGLSYVMVWRNAHDIPGHHYAPFKGHPSESSFRRFADSPVTLFCNDLFKVKKCK